MWAAGERHAHTQTLAHTHVRTHTLCLHAHTHTHTYRGVAATLRRLQHYSDAERKFDSFTEVIEAVCSEDESVLAQQVPVHECVLCVFGLYGRHARTYHGRLLL